MGASLPPKEANLFKLIVVSWKAYSAPCPPFLYVGVFLETMFLLKFEEPFYWRCILVWVRFWTFFFTCRKRHRPCMPWSSVLRWFAQLLRKGHMLQAQYLVLCILTGKRLQVLCVMHHAQQYSSKGLSIASSCDVVSATLRTLHTYNYIWRKLHNFWTYLHYILFQVLSTISSDAVSTTFTFCVK